MQKDLYDYSKPSDPNGEWWELWDDANDMPYYYHTTSGQAHWNQPADTPVISLTNVSTAYLYMNDLKLIDRID